jgi:hypothetical protein
MYLYQQAAQTLVSHLTAQGYKASADQNVVTIVLKRRQGQVSVGSSYGPRQVDYQDLRSADPECIQRALDWVRQTVGLRAKGRSVYRNVESRRSTLEENFDDILFRSKIFSRCPNPSTSDLQQYIPLVKKISKSVWGRFRKPLLAFGFESEDMETYAMVHLVTALHRYRTGDPERDTAIIGRYITQRLTEIIRKTKRKAMRCTADSEIRNFSELKNI